MARSVRQSQHEGPGVLGSLQRDSRVHTVYVEDNAYTRFFTVILLKTQNLLHVKRRKIPSVHNITYE